VSARGAFTCLQCGAKMSYINGRYVPNGGKGKAKSSGTTGWSGGGKGGKTFERKPGDEDVALERKFDVDILQPGESRLGYMFNMKPTEHYDDSGRKLSGMVLYFLQRDSNTFRCSFLYRPYMMVKLSGRERFDSMRDILAQRFAAEGVHAEILDKEDLSLEDHIIGRTRRLIKLSFENQDGLKRASRDLQMEMKRAQKSGDGFENDSSAMDKIEDIFEYDVPYVCRVCIDNDLFCGHWYNVSRKQMATSIDNIWDTQCDVKVNELKAKPGLRIFAWDIECTKEPLKFPDSAKDRITMISIMVDAIGYLIVNRSEVSQDIEPMEYTPKPEYEGIFDVFNEPDEASLLRRFFSLLRETNPHITVTFNGDFFDMPFVMNRCKSYNIDWNEEVGLDKSPDGDFYCGKWLIHMDCFCWVQRDSYLPCGARGLKAVTRYKLKYDPVELDPEDMTPFAKDRPQELAAYSVSDAVATYYLYMKYIHDFIFALASIIPYNPDDVLRRGSGTLCESLLMNQAYKANVVFPNKHVDIPLEFHEGTNRLIEQGSYEGARVECMRVGVFRSDIKETFQLEPSAFQTLLNDLQPTVDFFLTVEEKVKIEDVENYQEILSEVEKQLRDLCDPDKVAAQIGRRNSSNESPSKKKSEEDEYDLKPVEYEVIVGSAGINDKNIKKLKRSTERVIKDDFPLIYHLDVGAMYPNIILSNRLQPSAIVSKEFCAACSYNDPSNNCKRPMDWKWRGELYMATRADVKSIMNEMENGNSRYNQKDKDSGEISRVKWNELKPAERIAEITKAVRVFSQKAYSRMKSSLYESRNDVVCQRENPFYVNTVLDFRDRRYVYKRLTKEWGKKFEKAEEEGNMVARAEALDFMTLYDSLQLAHKCILNSFYGYVMRKGARWHSMKMAGIVTFTGSNLIRVAREFCEMVGLPIELDTDGIWCMLPKSFPDTFKFKMKNGKEIKMPYSNCVLNYQVHEQYTNHQYQDKNKETGEWETRSENSIFFEIDGPYKCMLLPSSTEEDKMLKKRYAVYNMDNSLAELKGFEIKRRGELKLIQVFQEEVFPAFLKGTSKQEVWNIVGAIANRWLDVIESKGKTMTDDEVLYFISEQKSMSKSVEASGSYKSVQITCAKRLAQFLGVDTYIKDAGVSCHMLISRLPVNAATTERPIPVKIFSAEHEVKKQWLRTWCEDPSLQDFDMRAIIDWDYYKTRLCAVFLKIITIPANFQKFANPCPRVEVPLWLKKRVAEQNDRFQQRGLGMYLKKASPDANGDPSKRKLGDLEDLVGFGRGGKKSSAQELPVVEFGHGPKKWLDTQRKRWAPGQTASKVGRQSLFDEGVAWTQVSADASAQSWHIIEVEQAQAPRSFTNLRVGDSVMAKVDDDDSMGRSPEAEQGGLVRRGSVTGFVGGLVKVMLEYGGERLCMRSDVTLAKEDGLYTVWALTAQSNKLHRFDVLMKRRIVLGLNAEFNPQDARTMVRPNELIKGMLVWPRDPKSKRQSPGTVKTAAPEVGLAGVTWSDGYTEVVFAYDLERPSGDMSKVSRDAPRNLKHECMIEVEMEEEKFKQQQHEGALADRGAAWPRVEAIYEAEQPLQFELISSLGQTVKLAQPETTTGKASGSRLRLTPADLTTVSKERYLPGLGPLQNVYLYLVFDHASSSRCFCGIFAPAISEAWAYFGGIDAAEGEEMRSSLEQLLSEPLTAAASREGTQAEAGSLPSAVRTTVAFAPGRSASGTLIKWAEQRLQDIRRLDGGHVCVLYSQLSSSALRGNAPTLLVDQRYLRHVDTLRETPMCQAPFTESDAHFPALDWPRWILGRFAHRVPYLFQWWHERLGLCRAAALPICNAPASVKGTVPAALDCMFGRQLQKESQLRWASSSQRPDLGEYGLQLVDTQEQSLEKVDEMLDKDLMAGHGGGQVSNPGVYRSVCLEVNLKQKLCISALQHARYLSDREGGELSKKLRREVNKVGDGGRNMDHTSETSITNFESLVNVVQSITEAKDAKAKEIATFRQRWAAQTDGGAAVAVAIAADDDEGFIQAMREAGVENAVLSAKLEEMRLDFNSQEMLLDGLYCWLSSPSSLLYDRALLRKVHQYMDRVLQMLMNALKRNGCDVIYASYQKVLFSTGKFRVVPDVQNFWNSFCDNIKVEKVLEPLELTDTNCLSDLFYGVVFLDRANWAGVPIEQSGQVVWTTRSNWKMAEFLPYAARQHLLLYASEFLVLPQQEIEKHYIRSALLGAEVADVPMDDPAGDDDGMDLDGVAGDCAAAGLDDAQDGADAGKPAAAPDSEAKPANDKAAATESTDKTAAQMDEEIRTFLQGDFFKDLRIRVLKCVGELKQQQDKEMFLAENSEQHTTELDDEPESDSSDEDEDGPGARERKQERKRRHIMAKWEFPVIPGRMQAPHSVEFELMRALVQILQLEECLTEHVEELRDRLCQKMKISSFSKGISFENPSYPIILRDVVCPTCCSTSHLDVTSHTSRAPGHWVCANCDGLYEKDALQARLVGLLESTVQAWQAQDVVCKKCKKFQATKLQKFCDCFGLFHLRYKEDDFKLAVKMMRSLVEPHDLKWLGETLSVYERLVH